MASGSIASRSRRAGAAPLTASGTGVSGGRVA
jgi:hypothetical protein